MNNQRPGNRTNPLDAMTNSLAGTSVDGLPFQFQKWLGRMVRARFAQIVAVGVAIHAGLGIFVQWKSVLDLSTLLAGVSPWITAVHHSMQAFIILILLLTLISDYRAKLVGEETKTWQFAVRVQSQFYTWFRGVWFAWLFLYSVMAVSAFASQYSIDKALNQETDASRKHRKNFIHYASSILKLDWAIEANDDKNKERAEGSIRIDESKVIGAITKMEDIEATANRSIAREKNDAERARLNNKITDLTNSEVYADLVSFRRGFALRDVVIHFVGNCQTLAYFACYIVLLCKCKAGTNGADLSELLFLGVVVFVLTVADVLGYIFDMHLHYHSFFGFAESLFGGIAMAMLYSRLESRRLGAPPWLMALLFTYAVIQLPGNMPVVSTLDQIRASLLFTLYLIAKVLFYFYVRWLFNSGLLFYYIHSRVANADTDDQERREFLAKHVSPPNPSS
jgi:hypothetical protein